MSAPGPVPEPPSARAPRRRAGLHHLELWTADLSAALPGLDWMLTALGWRGEPIVGWGTGRIWRHEDGSYIVLEESPDAIRPEPGTPARELRCRPGMNHVALTIDSRSALDALRADAPVHGWAELFGDAYPHAGGDDHTAWFGENAEGLEVEVVVTDDREPQLS